jgi:quercetin dioxygenase-like cupin family protein
MISGAIPTQEEQMESWDLETIDVQPHQPVVLSSHQEARAVAIALPAGEMLQDHQVHERAWLSVVSGEVEVAQDSQTLRGGAGFLTAFAPGERHEVRALSDTRLLLLLTPWPGEGHPSNR